MPIISVYIDERTEAALEKAARELCRTVEDLAEAAVSEAAFKYERPRREESRQLAADLREERDPRDYPSFG